MKKNKAINWNLKNNWTKKTKDFNHTRMVNLQYENIWSTYYIIILITESIYIA